MDSCVKRKNTSLSFLLLPLVFLDYNPNYYLCISSKYSKRNKKKEKSDDKTWNSSDAGLISFFISSCICYSTVEFNTQQVNSLTIT